MLPQDPLQSSAASLQHGQRVLDLRDRRAQVGPIVPALAPAYGVAAIEQWQACFGLVHTHKVSVQTFARTFN